MKQNIIRSITLLALILLVSACASQDYVMAPDTMPGEQLKLVDHPREGKSEFPRTQGEPLIEEVSK